MKNLFPGFCSVFCSLLLFSMLAVTGLELPAQNIANIGIEGWAAYTPGGRGGRIIHVSNLNASGSGSFSSAVQTIGARIVVFDVGGVIDLQGATISIKNPFLTIAGQTAPGKGITLVNGGLNIRTHDVILQHLRIRPGSEGHETGSWEPDGLSTIGAYKVVIDHCSFSWAVDENCSASGERFKGETPDEWRMNTSHDVTISNCIIAEALSNSTHTKGEHSKGSLIHDNATNIAILNNLYSCNKDRNPLFKGGTRGLVVNNYIYNPGSAAIGFALNNGEWEGYEHQTGQLTLIGNYLKHGPNTSSSLKLLNVSRGPCFVFMHDNITERNAGLYYNEHKGNNYQLVADKPIWHENIGVIPASEVLDYLLKNAGAFPWNRDEIDARIINDMLSGTGQIIDSEAEVGGLPAYQEVYRTFTENEWNTDCMLKLFPGLSLAHPEGWPLLKIDSTYTIEALSDSSADTFSYLELWVDGVSAGKLTEAPYKWDILISEAGNHELLVVARIKDSMQQASATHRFSVEDPLTSVKQINSACAPYISIYPNPFSENINISFALSAPAQLEVNIYNSAGMLLHTIINEYRDAGKQELSWSPAALSPGAYYVRIKINNEAIFNKVIYW